MVEEADEEVSGKHIHILDVIPPLTVADWDGSEGDYDGSSEPMDSVAELGPADDDTAL
jgi:hypothetical protein